MSIIQKIIVLYFLFRNKFIKESLNRHIELKNLIIQELKEEEILWRKENNVIMMVKGS